MNPGVKFTALLQAEIKPGWHLYSTTQPPGGPIPTRITLAAGQPFELAGTIEGPPPQAAFDKNFGINTEWYDASATFKIPVKVSAKVTPGKQKLKVNAFYQSCSATLCLPPVTEKLEAIVDVAPRVRGRK
ncbi:MAG TPA: protein-disulfide reductase DsbD N-terminal domain-containing protein [Acidobacteriota bacterium]